MEVQLKNTCKQGNADDIVDVSKAEARELVEKGDASFDIDKPKKKKKLSSFVFSK